jgi:Phage Mu protein F like protein
MNRRPHIGSKAFPKFFVIGMPRTQLFEKAAPVPQANDPALLEQADPWVKIWHVVGDSRTRESHFAVNGQVVFANEPFVVGDSLLDEPRDPDGPPDETYNCRCRVEYVRDRN